jgi:hypothetical protein
MHSINWTVQNQQVCKSISMSNITIYSTIKDYRHSLCGGKVGSRAEAGIPGAETQRITNAKHSISGASGLAQSGQCGDGIEADPMRSRF